METPTEKGKDEMGVTHDQHTDEIDGMAAEAIPDDDWYTRYICTKPWTAWATSLISILLFVGIGVGICMCVCMRVCVCMCMCARACARACIMHVRFHVFATHPWPPFRHSFALAQQEAANGVPGLRTISGIAAADKGEQRRWV